MTVILIIFTFAFLLLTGIVNHKYAIIRGKKLAEKYGPYIVKDPKS